MPTTCMKITVNQSKTFNSNLAERIVYFGHFLKKLKQNKDEKIGKLNEQYNTLGGCY